MEGQSSRAFFPNQGCLDDKGSQELEENMDSPVILRLVQSNSYPSGTGSYNYKGMFQIIVENLAYVKDVSVRAKVYSTWQDIPATYVESLPNNLEIWSAPASNNEDRFAVKYSVLGNTYWDNNDGGDYLFPKAYDEFNAITGRQCPVILGEASINGTQLVALVGIQNLAYTKTVGIVYTVDNWATVKTAYGSYYWTMSSGLEVWRIQAGVGAASEVKLAVFYFVSGSQYWDNNFWRNYTVTPAIAYVARALAEPHFHEPWVAVKDAKLDFVTSEMALPSIQNETKGRVKRVRVPIN
jgi:hypothetical protein